MSDDHDDQLLNLVGEIYDCAIEPARWTSTLERIARRGDGCCAVITLNHGRGRGFTLKAQWNVDPDHERVMRENYATNPALPALWYYDVDEIFTACSFCGKEYFNGGWHKRTLAPFGYGDTALAFLAKSPHYFGSMAILRELRLGVFEPSKLAELKRLVPHIRRAAMIANLLESRILQRDTLSATLDVMAAGIILTDADASIVHANAAAEQLMQSCNAIKRDGQMLAARDLQSAADLRQAIGSAASGALLNASKSGVGVPLKATDGYDLTAWILPLDRGVRGDLGAKLSARVAVFIRTIGDVPPSSAAHFMRRYSVTPAESRVLMLIAQGSTIAEIAALLGISVTTTKTHLSRLFVKTGTSRQAELVRLVMSVFPPP